MRIEKGFDKDNIECWFVLNGADLIGLYYTYEEAKTVVENG